MAVDTLDPNLLRSSKKQKTDAAPADLGAARSASLRKRIFKVFAYGMVFFWSLIFFTILKIPDSAIANFLLQSLNQNTPYQWKADSIKLRLFPFLHLKMEKLGLEPKFQGAGIPISLDEVRIYPNPLSLIPIAGPPAFGGSFHADVFKTTIHGSASTGSNTSLRLETPSLDLSRVDLVSQEGIDLKGNLSKVFFQLTLPNQRLASASGEISFEGKNIVFDPAALELGFPIPILNLGDVDLRATIDRGQLKFEKFKIGTPGKDLEVLISSGTIILSDIIPNTRYDLRVQLRPSAGIQAAMPGVLSMLDGMATKRPDGFYAMKLQGTLASPGFPVKD